MIRLLGSPSYRYRWICPREHERNDSPHDADANERVVIENYRGQPRTTWPRMDLSASAWQIAIGSRSTSLNFHQCFPHRRTARLLTLRPPFWLWSRDREATSSNYVARQHGGSKDNFPSLISQW